METIPHRLSLVSQTVAFLQTKIEAGHWRDRLPSERLLTSQLQVSRNTLRAALAQMRKDGLIRSLHGSGTEIVAPPGAPTKQLQSKDVAMLSPEPLERLQPRQTLLIDELRGLMSERGCRLHVFHGRRFFQSNSGATLKRLVAAEPHGCWILSMANREVQSWFQRNRVRCVVAGSTYPEIGLPFTDLDHRAVCRHAVGVLLRHGHSRMVYFAFKSSRAGESEGVEGFNEGVRGAATYEVETQIVYHDGTNASIGTLLRRLMNQRRRPTALLVANAFYFLAVATQLSQLGFKIPQDISLICRDESAFLNFFAPAPARYVVNPHLMARKLWRSVLEVLEGGAVTSRTGYIMPHFIAGNSIGPPAA